MMAATVSQGMTHLRMSDILGRLLPLSVRKSSCKLSRRSVQTLLTDRRVCRVEASAASVGWCLQSVF